MKLNPFRKESLKRYLDTDKHPAETLGAFDLLTIGIGAVVGTGIFILPGIVAAEEASPGVTLSFLVAALVCTLASIYYAELSSNIPVAGSAYSYGNILYGEVIGWTLGWTLILEYMLSVTATFADWTSYFNSLLHSFGLHALHHFEGPFDPLNGTYLSLWATINVLLIRILLSRGMRTSMKFNNAAVLIKIAIMFIFIGVGLSFTRPKSYHPFTPYGTTGVLRNATTVFFTFLGFDIVSSSATKVRDPKKNMPIRIIGTLIVAALFYMGVSVALAGMVNYKQLGVANSVTYALKLVGQGWVADPLSIGAIVGMSIMMLTTVYSSSRLIYSIGRDGLLPSFLEKTDKHDLPKSALWIVTTVITLMGGLFSLEEPTSLVSVETLLAFTFISFGVILLHRGKDIPGDNFKVLPYSAIPILSGLACIGMMYFLSIRTYLFAGTWFLFRLLIYCVHGYKHSKVSKKNN